MSTISEIIGARLRRRRLKLGYSQETAAEKASLHPTYIGQIERGEKNATIESIEKICNALNYPMEELFAKIIDTVGTGTESGANKCYNLLTNYPLSEQEELYHLLVQIINYKTGKSEKI